MPSDTTVLAFDTSAAHCAAALLCNGRIVAARREDMARGQAERLFPLLEETLQDAGMTWRGLTAIGVGTGPGNFTGIRISVSAARGLALSLGVPAIGVSILDAQAHGIDGSVISSLDAKLGNLYVQIRGQDPVRCTLDTLPDLAPDAGPVCVGFMATDIAALTQGTVATPAMPVAEAIARLAAERLGDDTLRPAPLYLRPADAAPSKDVAPSLLP